jgi:ABC-2 type transport system permease protein
MADVAEPIGLLEQIRLVAILRWRILRNSLRKKNNALDLIGLVFAGLFAGALVFGLSFAFYSGGYAFVSRGRPEWLALLFWAILIFWQGFPIIASGFGATFQFRTLLRFPLSQSAFYLISLAYGFADFSAIAAMCWLISMTLGATMAKPTIFPELFLVAVLFALMNVTLERLLSSWLERLLARRRTRELMFGLLILFSISLQLIGPITRKYAGHGAPEVSRILSYLAPFPPSLAGQAVTGAAMQQPGFLIGIAGLLVYLVVFSTLLWLRYAAQYRGEELSESVAPARVATRSAHATDERPISPGIFPPQLAAILGKEFAYLRRNVLVVVTMLIPPFFLVLISSSLASQRPSPHPSPIRHAMSADIFFPAMAGYLMLVLLSPAYNCFAYEGKGIQTYFMVPTRFREIFIAKNLLLGALLLIEFFLCGALTIWRAGLPSMPVLLATFIAFLFAVVGQLTIANWSSLTFPRKMVFGAMRGQRNNGAAAWISLGCQVVIGAICATFFSLGRWLGLPWLPLGVFTALAAAAIAGYSASLDPLSDYAEKKKELLIEALCR